VEITKGEGVMKIKTKYGEIALGLSKEEIASEIADSIKVSVELAIGRWLDEYGDGLGCNFGKDINIDFCAGLADESFKDMITAAIKFYKKQALKYPDLISEYQEDFADTAMTLRELADYIESEKANIGKKKKRRKPLMPKL
jgi:hypothetical protein